MKVFFWGVVLAKITPFLLVVLVSYYLPLKAIHLAPLGYAKISPIAINTAPISMPAKSQNIPENKKVKLEVLIVLW